VLGVCLIALREELVDLIFVEDTVHDDGDVSADHEEAESDDEPASAASSTDFD
jgi:hypothetical protein